MDIPLVIPYEEQAIDTVVSILNSAKEKLGDRQTLKGFANSRGYLTIEPKVCLSSLQNPLISTGLTLLKDIIEKKWKLKELFMYTLNYKGARQDECSRHYYFEAIFSQPTAACPIPQATVSVLFRIQNQLLLSPSCRGVPQVTFTVEGHNTEYDVRYVKIIPDWILAELQMKISVFRRIEELKIF
ncbi:hypothetical protein ACJJTC_009776 [Scirpophaga incertulas]